MPPPSGRGTGGGQAWHEASGPGEHEVRVSQCKTASMVAVLLWMVKDGGMEQGEKEPEENEEELDPLAI